jgi:hypothetical protein
VKSIRLAAFVAAIVSVAALIGSAGAAGGVSPSMVDLSTNAAVNTYLQSIGVDPATVVIQRGANNYAGPFCPGAGWNCTTATSVVQVASPGGTNQFDCGDPSLFPQATVTAPAAGYLANGRCLAIQDATAGTNTIDIERSTNNSPALACPPSGRQQSSAGGQNHFTCHLVIHISNDSLDQSATEQATITQDAPNGGGNHSSIDLEITLTSSVTAPTEAQRQNAWQRAVVDQTATGGAENHSDVSETQYLRGRISGATESNQYQNTAGIAGSGFGNCNPANASAVSDPNSCAVVTQNATPDGGNQDSQLSFLNDLDARTTAISGTQNQGCLAIETRCSGVTTGLSGTVPQPAAGSTDTSHETYSERQDVTAGDPDVVQNQTAPQSCCALQTGSATNSLVNADQTSTQNASTSTTPLDPLALAFPNPGATQITFLTGKIQTDGNGTLDQTGRQDNGTATEGCTLPPPPIESPTPTDEGAPACGSALFMVDGVPITCEAGQVPTVGENGFICATPPPPGPV